MNDTELTISPNNVYLKGLGWDFNVLCEKNEVDNQDEWLRLGVSDTNLSPRKSNWAFHTGTS